MASGNNNGDQEILRLRDELLSLASQLSARYACRKLTEKTVVNLLMEHVCERCIVEKLRLGVRDEDKVDRAWRNLHSYAVELLIERLKNKLLEAGFHVSIASEAENPTGYYDVLLKVDRTGIQILNGSKSICLEAKTGFNISFLQLEKYLWNGSTIILVRFATSDVWTFRLSEWATFLKTVLNDRIEKARRIIAGRVVPVQGPDCKECPLESCKFRKSRAVKEDKLGKNNGFTEALEGFKRNADAAIEAALSAVLVELNRAATQMRETDKDRCHLNAPQLGALDVSPGQSL